MFINNLKTVIITIIIFARLVESYLNDELVAWYC